MRGRDLTGSSRPGGDSAGRAPGGSGLEQIGRQLARLVLHMTLTRGLSSA